MFKRLFEWACRGQGARGRGSAPPTPLDVATAAASTRVNDTVPGYDGLGMVMSVPPVRWQANRWVAVRVSTYPLPLTNHSPLLTVSARAATGTLKSGVPPVPEMTKHPTTDGAPVVAAEIEKLARY